MADDQSKAYSTSVWQNAPGAVLTSRGFVHQGLAIAVTAAAPVAAALPIVVLRPEDMSPRPASARMPAAIATSATLAGSVASGASALRQLSPSVRSPASSLQAAVLLSATDGGQVIPQMLPCWGTASPGAPFPVHLRSPSIRVQGPLFAASAAAGPVLLSSRLQPRRPLVAASPAPPTSVACACSALGAQSLTCLAALASNTQAFTAETQMPRGPLPRAVRRESAAFPLGCGSAVRPAEVMVVTELVQRTPRSLSELRAAVATAASPVILSQDSQSLGSGELAIAKPSPDEVPPWRPQGCDESRMHRGRWTPSFRALDCPGGVVDHVAAPVGSPSCGESEEDCEQLDAGSTSSVELLHNATLRIREAQQRQSELEVVASGLEVCSEPAHTCGVSFQKMSAMPPVGAAPGEHSGGSRDRCNVDCAVASVGILYSFGDPDFILRRRSGESSQQPHGADGMLSTSTESRAQGVASGVPCTVSVGEAEDGGSAASDLCTFATAARPSSRARCGTERQRRRLPSGTAVCGSPSDSSAAVARCVELDKDVEVLRQRLVAEVEESNGLRRLHREAMARLSEAEARLTVLAQSCEEASRDRDELLERLRLGAERQDRLVEMLEEQSRSGQELREQLGRAQELARPSAGARSLEDQVDVRVLQQGWASGSGSRLPPTVAEHHGLELEPLAMPELASLSPRALALLANGGLEKPAAGTGTECSTAMEDELPTTEERLMGAWSCTTLDGGSGECFDEEVPSALLPALPPTIPPASVDAGIAMLPSQSQTGGTNGNDADRLIALSLRDLSEIKALKKPPPPIRMLMEVCCVVFSIQPVKLPDERSAHGKLRYDYWEPARRYLLSDPFFLQKLRTYEDRLSAAQRSKIRRYFKDPEFTAERVRTCSKAAHELYVWLGRLVQEQGPLLAASPQMR